MCTSKDPWVDSFYIIAMVKYCCSGNSIHQSHKNALETQNWSVCGLFLHPPISSNGKQHWDATEVLQEATLPKSPSSTCLFYLYSGWFLCPSLGVSLYKSISSSRPQHCNKVVFSVEQKSVDEMASFPTCRAGRCPWGYRKLSSTRSEESIPMSSIMSMSSMVSSSLLMKVELLEPVSMALSSDVWELEDTNTSEIKWQMWLGKCSSLWQNWTLPPHMLSDPWSNLRWLWSPISYDMIHLLWRVMNHVGIQRNVFFICSSKHFLPEMC